MSKSVVSFACTLPTDRIRAVESVGRRHESLEADTSAIVAQIIADLPDTFDPSVYGAVAGAVHDWATDGAAKADRPAVKSGPKGSQKDTLYGVGHNRVAKALAKALKGESTPEPGVIRISLSGEGGETITIKPGDTRYAAAVAAYEALASATDETAAA